VVGFVDGDGNNVLHVAFGKFGSEVESMIDFCGMVVQAPYGQMLCNNINNSFQSPVDLCIEQKQNQALEFCLYMNK